ncbi:MAG: hypothetical protein ACE5E7_19525 [Anaerolineae bacterium]
MNRHPIALLLILALTIVTASATAAPEAPEATTAGILIHAPNSTDDQAPKVAFASGSNQFLVVWENNYNNTGDYDIRGQYVSKDNVLLGNEFFIASTNTPERFPDVAYDAKTGVFLVVWEYGTGAATTKIQGRIIADDVNDSNGPKIGNTLDITDGTVNAAAPSVAHNENDDQYLVVYAYNNGEDMYGRRIWNSYGTPAPVAAQFAIKNYPTGYAISETDVAWGQSANTFLAVWARTSPSAAEERIAGRTVWDAHQSSGSQVQGENSWFLDGDAYNSGTLGSSDPAVVYDSTQNQYLTTYETNGASGGVLDWEIFYRRLLTVDPNNGNGIYTANGSIQADVNSWNPALAEVWGTDVIMLAYASVDLGSGANVKATYIRGPSDIYPIVTYGPANQDFIYDIAIATVPDATLSRTYIVSTQRQGDNDVYGLGVDSPCYPVTITSNPLNGGSVSPSKPSNCDPLNNNYLKGSVLFLTATPNNGYQFSSWNGSLSGTDSPKLLIVDGVKTIVANFEAISTNSAIYLPFITSPPGAITGFEVTQSVQDANNSVPLVANRDTLVRVYTTTSSNLPNRTVTLSAKRNGVSLGSITDGPKTMTTSSRGSFNSTYNFTLPQNWLTGNVTLTAADNGGGGNLSTNVSFTSVPPLNVTLVPIRYTHTGNGTTYPPPTQDNVSEWALRAFPVSAVNVTFRTEYTFAGNLNTGAAWNALLDDIALLKQSDGAPASTIYYGYIPFSCDWANCASTILGFGFDGLRVSIGVDATNTPGSLSPGEVAAHEWGHNMNRLHAPCGNPGNIDPNWPTDPKYSGASIGEYGIDGLPSGSPALLNPANYVDVMSYCNSEWVSDYTYKGLMQDQLAHGINVAAAAEESLLISAQVGVDGSITLGPIYAFPQAPTPASTGTGDYRIELLDEQGQIIAAYDASLLTAEEEGMVSRAIHTAVPLPDAPVAQVRIVEVKSSRLTAQRSLQTSPAFLAAANGGMTPTLQMDEAGHTAVIRWGLPDTLAIVRYTTDDGQTWTTLGLHVLGGELPVDVNLLPEGNGRFEIIPANSGVPARLSVEMKQD